MSDKCQVQWAVFVVVVVVYLHTFENLLHFFQKKIFTILSSSKLGQNLSSFFSSWQFFVISNGNIECEWMNENEKPSECESLQIDIYNKKEKEKRMWQPSRWSLISYRLLMMFLGCFRMLINSGKFYFILLVCQIEILFDLSTTILRKKRWPRPEHMKER